MLVFLYNSNCHAFEKKKLHAFYEGKKVKSARTLFTENGVGYIPVRDVAKIYRMTINWKGVSREVVLSIHGRSIVIKLDNSKVIINNVPRKMNRETKEIEDTVCVPIDLLIAQSFAEASRCITAWNNETLTLNVDKKVNVQPPHFYTDENKTSITVEYDHYVVCRDSKKRDRMILSFEQGISGSDEKFKVHDGVVEEITMKQKRINVLIEILLARGAGKTSVSYEKDPTRVVIDIERMGHFAVSPVVKKYSGSEKVIVIDPGHGGKDPGAVGRDGTMEKDLNLTLALKLANLLKREGKFTVILTRDDDTFVPLLTRADIANKKKADLFVSLHCNSSLKQTSEGFEIYFLSGTATDKAAAATAKLENSALQLEADSRVKKKKIDKILWSIAQNMFHRESADMCAAVLQQVQKRVKIQNRSAKQAQFYVLMNAKMPAVLVETGFISNRKEEARLKSKRFQAKMVDAYYAGIVDYFNKKQ